MKPVAVLILVSIVLMIAMFITFQVMFATRNKSSNKSVKNTKQKINSRLSANSVREKNRRMKAISDALNILPIGRLTPEKRDEINVGLASAAAAGGEIRIAEEIHVMGWMAALMWIIFVGVLTFFLGKVALLGMLFAPIVYSVPFKGIGMSVQDEEEVLAHEFRSFYNLYYVQFRRAGFSLRLIDVVQSYKGIAPKEMSTFISRLEVDLTSGEANAIRLLDKRYNNNPDVHRFCSIASLVSRGDGSADKVVQSFQEELTRKKIAAQRAELERRKALIDRVINAMLYFIACTMLIIVFIFTAMG